MFGLLILITRNDIVLAALLVFLVGCLVLAVVIWVAKLIIAMLPLPPEVAQIALVILGLIGLVIVILLAVRALQGQQVLNL